MRRRKIAGLFGAASAELTGDVFRDIPRPALRGVETNDANRIAILAIRQICDDRFETGGIGVSFAPRLPDPAAEVVEH